MLISFLPLIPIAALAHEPGVTAIFSESAYALSMGTIVRGFISE